MDKITEKIAALPPDANYFSLEFFPPKTQQGFSNLHTRLTRMTRTLRPLFVNVTWGAGGSTSEKSLALAELTQRTLGLTTCLHLTCTNMSRKLVDDALERAKRIGVRNILALRGDPPRSEEYKDENASLDDDSNKDFTWAADLVRYIRKQYGDHFCIGVAGYPEGHTDQSHPEDQSVEHDLPYLVEKVQAGADFIMTQLFYDIKAYESYINRLREHESGTFSSLPIIPGLMPVQSYQILKRTTKLSHARLPNDILQRFDAVKGDDEAVKRVGVDVICEIVEQLRGEQARHTKGFHFYTLNLEKSVARILERTKLTSATKSAPAGPRSAKDHSAVDEAEAEADGFVVLSASDDARRPSSSSSHSAISNRLIVSRNRRTSASSDQTRPFEAIEEEASQLRKSTQTQKQELAISEGEGSLGREATWDDFPNGRWGDARSPAYGEIDGYGASLHVSRAEALKLWGYPLTVDDINGIFARNLDGQLTSMPWSEEGLLPETLLIKDKLMSMNRKGWWTIASQPAVSGVPSTHEVFGWGPRNGFVFQKPFVEFFLSSSDWDALRQRLEKDDQITYFAGNASGKFVSSDEESVNPVTWGAFTGKEIVTPTIIEAESFRSWLEEAFGMWAEWQRIYPPASASSKLLESVRKDYWLVNIIHHGFVENDALWDTLLAS